MPRGKASRGRGRGAAASRRSSEGDKRGKTQITGYIVRDEHIRRDDDDILSDADDDDFDFSGNTIKKCPLNKTKVMIQVMNEEGAAVSMQYVQGKFPITSQHWNVTLTVKTVHDAKYSDRPPSYRFRPAVAGDRGLFKETLYKVFHSHTDPANGQPSISDEYKAFLSFIDRQSITDFTPFYHKQRLSQLIEECALESGSETKKAAILYLIKFLHMSYDLSCIQAGLECPLAMMELPLLYPKLFYSILKHELEHPGMLNKIEPVLKSSPWELAFSQASRGKLAVSLPEVGPADFKNAGVWSRMEQPYQDAVMVYSVLKEHCYSLGDTYMSVHRLNGLSPRYNGHILSHFQPALEYLRDVRAVHIEGDRVYLKKLYDSENYIAVTITNMVNQPSLQFPVNFDEEPLSALASDPDQRAAAEMISQKPVVMMSGRGGCGKTEVVSRVCQVALQHVYLALKLEHDNFIRQRVHKAMERVKRRSVKLEQPDAVADTENGVSTVAAVTGGGEEGATNSTACLDAEMKKLSDVDDPDSELNTSAVDLFDEGQSADETGSSKDESSFTKLKQPPAATCPPTSDMSPPSLDDFDDDFDDDANADDDGPSEPDRSGKKYILLTAPTGKAAKVLGRRTGFTGYTLHQVMWKYVLWRKEQEVSGRPFPFRDVRILVVDECSLVAVQNISFVLNILKKESHLQRIIFLGDLLQLPSIEPGNFITDMYAGLSGTGCAISLRTNHRSEGRLIVENAIRISGRGLPAFDPKRNFSLIRLVDTEDAAYEREEAVRQLIKTPSFQSDRNSQFVAFRRMDCEWVNNICAKAYTGQICIDPASKKMSFSQKFKICCGKNGTVKVIVIHDPNHEASSMAVEAEPTLVEPRRAEQSDRHQRIDEKIEAYMNALKQVPTSESLDAVLSDKESQLVEDRVAEEELKASQRSTSERKDNSVAKARTCDMRLCNGEMFWIKAILKDSESGGRSKKERWIIEGEDGLTLSVYRSDLVKECRVRPSWCRTIHTFQGSEIQNLAYVVGTAGRQNWQHVYTAVTRGKTSVSIIANSHELYKAVSAAHQRRFCSLEEKLKEILGIPHRRGDPDVDSRVIRTLSHPDGYADDSLTGTTCSHLEAAPDDAVVWGDADITVTGEYGEEEASQFDQVARKRRRCQLAEPQGTGEHSSASRALPVEFTSGSYLLADSSRLTDQATDGFPDTDDEEEEMFALASQQLDRLDGCEGPVSGGAEATDGSAVIECRVIPVSEVGPLAPCTVVIEPDSI